MSGEFDSLPQFSLFAEDVLIEAAGQQRYEKAFSVRLPGVLSRLNVDPFDGWTEQVIPYLQSQGWVSDDSTLSERRLRVLGSGFAQVEIIAAQRRPRTITDRLASDRTQKLLNVGAFATSLVSLVVAIIALAVSAK